MMEIWKPVQNTWGAYSVSSEGRVRSESRLVDGSRGVQYLIRGRILKTRRHPFGYPVVTMSIRGKCVSRTVHSLVAEAFMGTRPDGLVVCHSDGDPTNNSIWNLRYGTQASNVEDSIKHGTKVYGSDHGGSVLSMADVNEMRTRRAAGETLAALAEHFGVAEPTVWKITTGEDRPKDPGPITKSKKVTVLDKAQREEVRRRRLAGELRKNLVAEFGISKTQFDNIMKGSV
ncbi:HNH endonuclease [Novosphingobium sp. NPDC080210]|uniref:HNH endonuclease n=1 Tax=Novosphingobium sp. NPDC080210 TaxID=3390596 RepID=UPI003D026075